MKTKTTTTAPESREHKIASLSGEIFKQLLSPGGKPITLQEMGEVAVIMATTIINRNVPAGENPEEESFPVEEKRLNRPRIPVEHSLEF
jgi:hypothetical protein